MKSKFFFIIYFCLFFPINLSIAKNYTSSQIKHYIEKTPRNAENHVYSLTRYLTAPFDNDYDKAKAIAFWIASHINYDDYLYNNGTTTRLIKQYKPQTPESLLQSRVGICGDFTNLFFEMCKKANIQVYYVSGYAYPKGKSLTTAQKSNSSHAWNYFKYKNRKVYVDTTFMSQGTTEAKKSINQTTHKRALKNIKKANQKESQLNDFDDFYFDFTYEKEEQKRNYKRKEEQTINRRKK